MKGLLFLTLLGAAFGAPGLTFETIDGCSLPEGTLRIPSCPTIDGENNNEMNDFGEALTNLLRVTDADYIPDPVDGNLYANPREAFAPDARTISNTVNAHGASQPNGQMLSDFAVIWGQFMDHDLALTPANGNTTTAFDEVNNCPVDLYCGDGVCGPWEFANTLNNAANTADTITVLDSTGASIGTLATCPDDCGVLGSGTACGDGMCDGGEDECSCPQDCEDEFYRGEIFNIAVRAFDPAFDPTGDGDVTLPLSRSIRDETIDESVNFREQVNLQTSFIDASTVYGPELERALLLRAGEGCLRTTVIEGEIYPPLNGQDGITIANDGNSREPTEIFVAGDERINEQGGLFGLHVLWVREHNFQAARIAATAPSGAPFSDEEIFQLARHIVIGEIQFITYEEWLPVFIGELSETYAGYNDTVDASVSNEFQHGVFRLGHTMLNERITRIGADGETFAAFDLALADTFFQPERITLEGGLDPVWRGMSSQVARAYDPFLVDAVRIMLFGPPLNGAGMDLAALNIQRAREHGIDDYNDLRVAFGLNRHNSFPEITENRQVQLDLHALYGTLTYIDPWVGALSEDVHSGTVGQLAYAVLDDQFRRLRDGDRYFYLADGAYSAEDLQYIRSNGRLSQVLLRNSGIACLPENAFVVDPDFDYSCS